MATSKQEHIYNEIVEYYNFADKLISASEDVRNNLNREQFEAIESLVEGLEKCADNLTTQYLEFVKNGNSRQISENIKNDIDIISAKIKDCRAQIINLDTKV